MTGRLQLEFLVTDVVGVRIGRTGKIMIIDDIPESLLPSINDFTKIVFYALVLPPIYIIATNRPLEDDTHLTRETE